MLAEQRHGLLEHIITEPMKHAVAEDQSCSLPTAKTFSTATKADKDPGHAEAEGLSRARQPRLMITTRRIGYATSVDRFLRIYLEDQLALGVLWRQLARRAQRNNTGTPLGEAAEHVATGIAEDVVTFKKVMRRIRIRPNRSKVFAAIVAERLGRLKPNGRMRSYSPLSRFVELEFLTMGIDGKKQMWATLRDLAGLASRLPDVNFDALIDRAEQQRAELEPFRARAGNEAFNTTTPT